MFPKKYIKKTSPLFVALLAEKIETATRKKPVFFKKANLNEGAKIIKNAGKS